MSDISDLDILTMAADIADRESMATWRSDDLEFETKPDGSPVSVTDKLIERLLRELLAEHRPGDRIIGEEEGETAGETAVRRRARPDRVRVAGCSIRSTAPAASWRDAAPGER